MKILKKIIVFISAIRLIPHLIVFYTSSKKTTITTDIKVNGDFSTTTYGLLYLLTFEKTFRNLFYHRIGNIHWLFSFLSPRCSSLFLNPNMQIGNSAKFTHNHTTHINANIIGDNFECLHLVTIGAWNGGLPIIGDNVKVYCGAIIIGNIHVGNNVKIGAGAVVTKSIPDNCTIIGSPAKIVKQNGQRVEINL